MTVLRSSNRQTKVQPPANFTGVVFSDEIVQGSAPSRMRASVVSFTPGGRTAWHSHPVGQTLYCLSGAGSVETLGKRLDVQAGQLVWIANEEPHAHFADPASPWTVRRQMI